MLVFTRADGLWPATEALTMRSTCLRGVAAIMFFRPIEASQLALRLSNYVLVGAYGVHTICRIHFCTPCHQERERKTILFASVFRLDADQSITGVKGTVTK